MIGKIENLNLNDFDYVILCDNLKFYLCLKFKTVKQKLWDVNFCSVSEHFILHMKYFTEFEYFYIEFYSF